MAFFLWQLQQQEIDGKEVSDQLVKKNCFASIKSPTAHSTLPHMPAHSSSSSCTWPNHPPTQTSCADPLAALSGMCTDMPAMSGCVVFTSWCGAVQTAVGGGGAATGLEWYCSSGGGGSTGLPSMLMYFHERTRELVLWKSWEPKTDGEGEWREGSWDWYHHATRPRGLAQLCSHTVGMDQP